MLSKSRLSQTFFNPNFPRMPLSSGPSTLQSMKVIIKYFKKVKEKKEDGKFIIKWDEDEKEDSKSKDDDEDF